MTKNYKSIYSALIANSLIAVTKFVAGALTNSSSMISEGIHSAVDTLNEILLLYGLKRSRKPPDRDHPFGYGTELYFWSFIVAILIFGLGGGLSIYQGIEHIRHPEALGNPTWNYIVLGLSFLFEGISLVVAIREFDKTRGGLSWWEAIVKTKDPSTFIILFEDAAAVLGVLIVFILMLVNQYFDLPVLDGVASVIVGLLLVSVSIIVARESRSLLLGEGIAPESKRKLIKLAESDPDVVKVLEVISNYESPEKIVLILTIVFKTDLASRELLTSIKRIKARIAEASDLVIYVIIQPQGA